MSDTESHFILSGDKPFRCVWDSSHTPEDGCPDDRLGRREAAPYPVLLLVVWFDDLLLHELSITQPPSLQEDSNTLHRICWVEVGGGDL